jgi:two-component system CheB/CheR fusion protein
MEREPDKSPEPAKVSVGKPRNPFFVVGVGASAGGLNAFSDVLSHLPAQSDLSLVIVQHLHPDHESSLSAILAQRTQLPVEWATAGAPIQPGRAYVLPPRHLIKVRGDALVLEPLQHEPTATVIDVLFRSLADEYKHRAIGVLLSGNGSDGVVGLKAIKAAGGITFVQEEETAAHPSMPHAAIAADAVDHILPPAQIADELVKLTQRSDRVWTTLGDEETDSPSVDADHLSAIFRLLNARTGVDFRDYKQSTIKRRLVRRMVLTKTDSLTDYVKLLQKDRDEVEALYEGMLINVTEFFRDPESFEFLREHIFPGVIAHHEDNSPIRIWVPGCSTGEEAYSLGILVREALEASGHNVPVQIFGTDICEAPIATARAGCYTTADVANITPERLRRFFFKTERGYVIQKAIRDMCVFARQNVTKDSPFSRLDLISCRNLLIYLGPNLQRKLMPVFHYALNPGGHLILGSSESVGPHADLFRLVDRRFRIYSRKSTTRRANFEFAVEHPTSEPHAKPRPLPIMPDDSKESFDVMREADRIVLGRHGPPGVLVNEDMEILQFRGNVAPYIAPLPGRASLSLTKMAREGLAAELEAAVLEAKKNNVRIQKSNIRFMQGDQATTIDLDITPMEAIHTKERFYLILFSSRDGISPRASEPNKTKPGKAGAATSQFAQIEQLKQDLQATRSYLQTTIEKHEATNQELRAANEEIQSSNEELQLTNEELETAKEELQSTNEELTTVNEELHSRHLELIQVNNDLNNLINSVHLPIII